MAYQLLFGYFMPKSFNTYGPQLYTVQKFIFLKTSF